MTELLKKLEEYEFNCFAHVHTHPYLKEANRFFSEEDIDYYKRTFNFSKIGEALNKKFNTFGCILTGNEANDPEKDDISFVYYNEEDKQMHYLPNIFVKSKKRRTNFILLYS